MISIIYIIFLFDVVIIGRDEGHLSDLCFNVFVSNAEEERGAYLAMFSIQVSHGDIGPSTQAW